MYHSKINATLRNSIVRYSVQNFTKLREKIVLLRKEDKLSFNCKTQDAELSETNWLLQFEANIKRVNLWNGRNNRVIRGITRIKHDVAFEQIGRGVSTDTD